MIISIDHKGLRLLWEKDDPSKLPPAQVRKILDILNMLDAARNLGTIKKVPGYRLHALSGTHFGYWSITVTGNYRIIFRFENKNVCQVDYLDYH